MRSGPVNPLASFITRMRKLSRQIFFDNRFQPLTTLSWNHDIIEEPKNLRKSITHRSDEQTSFGA
jgi:hypothetical protein